MCKVTNYLFSNARVLAGVTMCGRKGGYRIRDRVRVREGQFTHCTVKLNMEKPVSKVANYLISNARVLAGYDEITMYGRKGWDRIRVMVSHPLYHQFEQCRNQCRKLPISLMLGCWLDI